MRPLLLPGLLDAARRNATHGRVDVGLFESAHVYAPRGATDVDGSGSPPARERHHVAGVIAGHLPGSWRTRARQADFYAAVALVEGLLDGAGVSWGADPAPDQPFLHPGRAASVVAGEETIGWVGDLHPAVAAEWDLGPVAAFEVDLDSLLALASPEPVRHRDTSAFPAVIQDMAVVVEEHVPAARVKAAIAAAAGELLASARLFDVYRGDQVGKGRKSLALRLELRAPDRTLTEAEAAEARGRVERELERMGGRLRA